MNCINDNDASKTISIELPTSTTILYFVQFVGKYWCRANMQPVHMFSDDEWASVHRVKFSAPMPSLRTLRIDFENLTNLLYWFELDKLPALDALYIQSTTTTRSALPAELRSHRSSAELCDEVRFLLHALEWRQFHGVVLDLCLALAPLRLPPYVVLWILDWLPY